MSKRETIPLLRAGAAAGYGNPPFEPSPQTGRPDRPAPLPYRSSRIINSSSTLAPPHRAYPVDSNEYQRPILVGRSMSDQEFGEQHMLRRKTPNGTLAAGYDGTPVQWSSKAPALKHVVLDASGGSTFSDGSNGMAGTGWNFNSPNNFNNLDQQIPSYFSPTGFSVPTARQPAYQPGPGPTASNDGGLYGPYWPDGSYTPYRPAAYRDHTYGGHNFQPINHASDYYGGAQPLRQSEMNNINPPFQRDLPFMQVNDHSQSYDSMSQNLYQTGGSTNGVFSDPSRPSAQPLSRVGNAQFKEKTLSWAHTIYLNSASPPANAQEALDLLTTLCEESNWAWIDGMLLGGCLAYGLEDYNRARDWYEKIIVIDPRHVEAISNLAATLLCLQRRDEAEANWRKSVNLRPNYFEAVEHLIGLLCGDHRGTKHRVTLIENSKTSRGATSDTIVDYEDRDHPLTFNDRLEDSSEKIGFGSSGFAIPGSENGRILALIHAKGNMLYALGDVSAASKAFEDAVVISAGKGVGGIQGLIRRIIDSLTLDCFPGMRTEPASLHNLAPASLPLLLPPEKALEAKTLVFPRNGELPGLRYVPQGLAQKAAISTTSNSLLSLAKIFQDAMSNSTSQRISKMPKGVGDILALYYLSLSLQPSPSTANNVGILLASVQQPAAHRPIPSRDTTGFTAIPGVVPGSGVALALAYYNYGLLLDSRHAHLYTNLGSLLKDIGQLPAAIKMYEKAVQCDGTFDIALANLANAVKDQGRTSDAIQYYKRAVKASPDFAEALEAADCGGEWSPDKRESIQTALSAWAGHRWEGARIVRLVERATKRATHRWYIDRHVKKKEYSPGFYPRPHFPSSLSIPSAPTVLPFHTFTCPLSAKDIRLISQRNALRISCSTLRSPWMQGSVFPPPSPPRPHLNIGYVSSDFNNHPLAHLMQSVFGFHNPSRAKAFCYATTASDNSVHRQQIEREAPVFRDVSSWTADRLVNQIVQDGIHILINLNGYTRGARNEVFAARPAPIQMSFMGFAGTLGAEWCDYLLADETAIPPETLRPWRKKHRFRRSSGR
ncbi:hypothetical protein EYC84_007362 [Monilinia fructicola]|uniref:protein O-GlcNAc transferase n=1 Tax=Monilinia fructicola TaxID=38448 RepID=A0A5M9JKR3_MONFR|nr:hypothetical protein EYC84_007362 [Monilinia fructicola]